MLMKRRKKYAKLLQIKFITWPRKFSRTKSSIWPSSARLRKNQIFLRYSGSNLLLQACLWYHISMLEKNSLTSISITTGTMVRAILVLLVVFLIWFLRDLVLVVLTSIVIASFVESAVPYFNKLHMHRVVGIVVLYIFSLTILAGVFYLFSPLLITEIYIFSNFISAYIPGDSFFGFFKNEEFSGAKDIISSLGNNFSISSLFSVSKAFVLNLSGGFFQTVSVAFGSFFNFVLIIVISFYLSIQEKGIENFLRLIFPIHHDEYLLD